MVGTALQACLQQRDELAHCPKAAMRLRFLTAGWCACSGVPPPPSSWSAASMARGRRIRPSSCAACGRDVPVEVRMSALFAFAGAGMAAV